LIVLDTNVLPRDGSLAGPTIALVQAIAEKTGHQIALPAIVIEESVAIFYRELRKEWDKASTAAKALARFLPGYRIEEPDLIKRAEQWRADLERSFALLEAPPGAADEALRREAHRIAPTRSAGPKGSGSGARDALIWLTVLDAYRQEPASGVTYFVTNNSADFGDAELLPSLQHEVDAVATTASFRYLTSMTDLLDALATPAGRGPTAADLGASRKLRATVAKVLKSIDIIGDDSWWLPAFRPPFTEMSLRRAEAGSAYEVGGRRFAAVSTIWELVSSTLSTSTEGSGLYESIRHYTARLLLLVELGDDGLVTAADIANAGPLVYERTETRTMDEA
jgi:PIN domain-containing protein